MSLSLDFWLDLAGVAIVFALIIVAIPKYRAYKIKSAHAHRLRVEVSDNIKMVLPNIAATSIQKVDARGQHTKDSTALKFCLFQLDTLIATLDVLYSEERDRVARFRNGLHVMIGNYDAGKLMSVATEDLILLGERIIEDLRENGLLSTVTR
ncbi:MAG: hypothetical protein ACJA2E_000143 [Arenicella sp.]|jgi:hypothetical protein